MILFAIGLSSFCVLRRHRRRKEAAIASDRNARGDDAQDTRLYFQQKAELGNKSIRLQMKTVAHRYELESENRLVELEGRGRILELPGEERRQKGTYTQESEQAIELDTSR